MNTWMDAYRSAAANVAASPLSHRGCVPKRLPTVRHEEFRYAIADYINAAAARFAEWRSLYPNTLAYTNS